MSTLKWKQEHKDEQSEYYKTWYKSHKTAQYSRVLQRREKISQWLNDLKLTLKCETCGNNHPAVIQFHHIDPSTKDGSISNFTQTGWSIDRIKKEISKCKVLCANCHFILHWNKRQP